VIEQIHFMRPYFFLLFVVLAFLLWRLYKASKKNSAWSDVCDQQLISYLLVQTGKKRSYIPLFLLSIVGILTVIAMAGPAWDKLPQAVYKDESARVFVLDMSRSMDSTDITPSRADRAKLKLIDLLKANKEGQSALVVFAGQAHIVSPLTDDSKTISNMVPSLSTDILPVQGSRADLAIKKAALLLQQSNSASGDIIMITDGVNLGESLPVAEKAAARGYRLSIIGIGSEQGAPVPVASGGFLKDNNGAIVLPKLDRSELKELALAGSGRYLDFAVDDKDVKQLITSTKDRELNNENPFTRDVDLWQDEGHWFLLAALPFAALAFRRGWLGSVILVSFMLPSNDVYAFEWKDLWQNKNQQAAEELQQGNADKAATLFNDEAWKGTAHYRNGDFEKAGEYFSETDSADGKYNYANALARQGKLQEAIDLYDEVLKENPEHEDAKFNKELVSKLKQDQQSDQNSESDENQDGEKQDGEKNDQQDQAQSDQSQSDESQESDQQQNQSSESKDGKEGEQDNQQQMNEQTDSEQQQSEEQKAAQQQQAEKEQDGDQEGQTQQQENEDKSAEDAERKEIRQATEQWLRRIPDDPGGLLREKFRRENLRQRGRENTENEW